MSWTSIIVVSAILAAAPRYAPAVVEVDEVARIGVVDGEPEYLFGRISLISALKDGRVIAADSQLEQIRVYDSSGKYLGDIGRAGEGPGEYKRLQSMTALPDGQLVVLSSPGRLTFFKIDDRSYVIDFSIPDYLHASRMLEYDNEGFVYVRALEEMPRPDEEWSFEWLKVSRSGEIVDRVAIPREDADPRPFVLVFPEGARQNFVTATKSTLSPKGFVVSGRNDRYSFVIHSNKGPINVKREVPVVKLGEQERREWQAWAEFFKDGHHIPESKPAFRELYSDSDGRIWVHRYVEARDYKVPPREPGDNRPVVSWREPTVFDVFSSGGAFLGTVELPGLTGASAFAGEHVWGVQSTDAGEQLIHWRVQGFVESPSE